MEGEALHLMEDLEGAALYLVDEMEGEAFYGQGQPCVLLFLVRDEKVAQHLLRVQLADLLCGDVVFPKNRRGPCLLSKLLGQLFGFVIACG